MRKRAPRRSKNSISYLPYSKVEAINIFAGAIAAATTTEHYENESRTQNAHNFLFVFTQRRDGIWKCIAQKIPLQSSIFLTREIDTHPLWFLQDFYPLNKYYALTFTAEFDGRKIFLFQRKMSDLIAIILLFSFSKRKNIAIFVWMQPRSIRNSPYFK